MIAEFVDTNVLIYALDRMEPSKSERAARLLEELKVAGNLAVSIQVLSEFYSAISRRNLASPAKGIELLRSMKGWTIHEPTHRDLVMAAETRHAEKISWWDALIVTSAQALNCDTLWSEDFTHGRRFGPLTVRNPFHDLAS